MPSPNPYQLDLDKNAANYVPLTPLTFIRRTADVYPERTAVLEAGVVARPDEKWGETPCAFITLKEGATVTEQEIIDFCRQHLAHFKAPRSVVFGPLPKTSTGKLQKFKLRDQAKAISAPARLGAKQ